MTTTISHIGIIGYGNVGSHLSHILSRALDVDLVIYNRSPLHNSPPLPRSTFTRNMGDLQPADIILIAVSDDAIVPILKELRQETTGNPVVCHTAGSVSADTISSYFNQYGVLYPLQTFSKQKDLHDSDFPVFITGSDPNTVNRIRLVADRITPTVHEIDDQQRQALHVAAVFTCNYTNAMYTIGHRICIDHDLDFNYLLPLIEETAQKIFDISPHDAQTGPAVRGDREVILKHSDFLQQYDPKIQDIYRQLAKFINQKL